MKSLWYQVQPMKSCWIESDHTLHEQLSESVLLRMSLIDKQIEPAMTPSFPPEVLRGEMRLPLIRSKEKLKSRFLTFQFWKSSFRKPLTALSKYRSPAIHSSIGRIQTTHCVPMTILTDSNTLCTYQLFTSVCNDNMSKLIFLCLFCPTLDTKAYS